MLRYGIQNVELQTSRWLVDDAQNVQARNGTGILGSLALRIVEVSRNSHDRVGNSGPQITFCGFLHFIVPNVAQILMSKLLSVFSYLSLRTTLVVCLTLDGSLYWMLGLYSRAIDNLQGWPYTQWTKLAQHIQTSAIRKSQS